MSRRRNNGGSNIFWWIFIFMIFGGGSFIPLLLIVGIVMAIMFAAVNSNRQNEMNYYSRPSSSSYRRQRYTAAQMAKINVFLRKWFRVHKSLAINNNVSLRIRGQRYASLASLDVYRDNTFICTLNDFGKRYPDSYDEILEALLHMAETQSASVAEVIDAEVVENRKEEKKQEAPKQETPKQEEKPNTAQEYINTINSLNDDIPDEDISNGLFETCALLKQIQTLEQRLPNSKGKLKKLYEYYLPILVRILKQYDTLQAAKTDPAYEETKVKLARTITLINDAMKTIISSMTDEDFINLSADISTLEAVLQKDGLTSDAQLVQRPYSPQNDEGGE